MSFDLFFCWHKQALIDFNVVTEWSQKHPHFQKQDQRLWYANEDTGVYFGFDFEVKEPEESSIPSNYVDSGLSFNLNFNRPSFFGHEAMPFVADLCQTFGLAVFDPQAPDQQTVSEKPHVAKLLESWLLSNKNAITTLQEFAKMAPPPRMPLSKSMYLWNYSRDRQQFQAAIEEDVFVPTLIPLKKRAANQVGTAFVCTTGVPMIIPESDWVIITRPGKRLLGFGAETETGVVTGALFREALAGCILTFDKCGRSDSFISPETVHAAQKRLQSLRSLVPAQEFEAVARDSFIDLDEEIVGRPN